MEDGRRTRLLIVLAVLLLVAAVRMGFVVHDYREAQKAAAEALEKRFHASSQVLAFLNRGDASAPSLDGQFPCVSGTVVESEVKSELGTCAMPASQSGPVDRFEADLRYGHFVLRQTDLYLNDVFEVPLTRTYNSGDYIHPNRVHAFGNNTNHPYDIAPLGSRFPYTYNMLVLEDGDFLFFQRVSAGTNYSDAIFQHTETSTKFYKAVTAWNEGGWTTWLTDGTTIVFPEAYSSTNMAQCAATEMRDAQGNSLKLLRDKQGNLQEIRTPHGHGIKLQYDEQSRIVRAQDDGGKRMQYRYNENGMLADAADSSGHQRHYTYQGALMTEIQNEKRTLLLRNTYASGTLVQQDFGNGQVYSFRYMPAPSRTYFETVAVSEPDGSQMNVETAHSVSGFVKGRSE